MKDNSERYRYLFSPTLFIVNSTEVFGLYLLYGIWDFLVYCNIYSIYLIFTSLVINVFINSWWFRLDLSVAKSPCNHCTVVWIHIKQSSSRLLLFTHSTFWPMCPSQLLSLSPAISGMNYDHILEQTQIVLQYKLEPLKQIVNYKDLKGEKKKIR